MTKPKSISKITPSNPPPVKVPKYDWPDIAEQLRAAPNKWHLIFEGDLQSIASAVRQGLKDLPLDEFEIRTANNTRGVPRTCDLWLKFVPKKKGRK